MVDNPTASCDSMVCKSELFALLGHQIESLGHMKQLVQRQREAVVLDNPESLLDLLKQRQLVMASLATRSVQIKQVHERGEQYRECLDSDDQLRARQLMDDIAKSFEEILEADARDVRVLAAKKQLIGNALRATHETAHAVSAYTSRRPAAPTKSILDEAS